MNAYTSTVTCATCGQPLTLTNQDPGTNPRRHIDVLQCTGRTCGTTWAYIRELAVITAHNQCGTPAGYQRHRRNGENICADCRRAWNHDAQDRRRSRTDAP